MAEYIVKVGFWLRAFEGVTIEADSDAEAIEKAKIAAATAMQSNGFPDHIDLDERRQGIIAYIDCKSPGELRSVIDDLPFDTDRIGHETA